VLHRNCVTALGMRRKFLSR